MIVYSLATQAMYGDVIDVSLYLTEWQAYEALADGLMPWDESDPEHAAEAARFEALKARLHKEGTTIEVVELFREALVEQNLIANVRKHDHPWTFPALPNRSV